MKYSDIRHLIFDNTLTTSTLYGDRAIVIWIDGGYSHEDPYTHDPYVVHILATHDSERSHWDNLSEDAYEYWIHHLDFSPIYIRWAGYDDKPRYNAEGAPFVDSLPEGWRYRKSDTEIVFETPTFEDAENAFRQAIQARLNGKITVASSYYHEAGDFFRRKATTAQNALEGN